MLLANVCASIAVLITRSALWHAILLLFYDGARREQYCRAARRHRGLTPHYDPDRDALRRQIQERNSPFGRALARRLERPAGAKKDNPGKTRRSVNVWARTGLIAAVPLCLLNALPLLSAILHVHWRVILIELLVAISANLLTWPAGMQAQPRGPLVTLLAMLATAIVTGTIAGCAVCTLTRDAPTTTVAAVTFKYV